MSLEHASSAVERATYWQPAGLSDIDLLRASFVTHTYSRHVHDTYAIGVIERGTERFVYRRARLCAPAGSVVVVNPAELHDGHAATADGWAYRMFYPRPEVLQQAAREITGKPHDIPFFPEGVIWDETLAAHLRALHIALEGATSPLEHKSRMLWTFAQLILRHADDRLALQAIGPEPDTVHRVRAYLHDHIADQVTLDDIARLARLSPFHLLRVFGATTGMPPHAYQTQLRVRRAKELLRAGLPIAEVAYSVGFADQSHLTRHFKRSVGVPPGQFAATARTYKTPTLNDPTL